jgi:hypothetical protein
MLTSINGDDRSGDVACAVAYEKRGESADIVDINQMMLRRRGRRGIEQFIEAVDSAGGSGTDGPRRDRVRADSLRA